MRFNILTIIVLIVAFISTSNAQTTPTYAVKGIISDSLKSQPLPMATITIKSATGQIVKNLVSKTDGTFSATNLAVGKYTLIAVNLGYVTKSILFSLLDKDLDLGTIQVREQANELKTVAVTADKPLIKQEIDRIAYDIQADPESKANNVLEMMRKVPMLSVDAEDNVQLKGSGNYKILINGKPSPMMDRNAKDLLKAMQASNVKSIEVITDPPAKYDSEGLSGIINIITTKKVDNGYNANLSLRETFPGNGPTVNGSVTAKQGNFGWTGFGVGYISKTLPARNLSSRISTGDNPTSLVQEGRRGSDNQVWFGGTELSYEIDSLNLIAAQVNINGYLSDGDNYQTSLLTDPTQTLERYDIASHNRTPVNTTDLALNYQLGFKSNKNRILTFSYRYTGTNNDQLTNVVVSNKIKYNLPDYNQVNRGNSRDQTFQLDYVHPLKKVNIEAGIKGIMRDNNSDFRYSELNSSGAFIEDPNRSNTYDNKQNVFSAYNSYQYTLKDWGIKAGLRLEQTVVDADFISSASTVNQNYFNLIPSVLINRKFKNMSSVSLGYTQRIERPMITTLNPFTDRQNPSYLSTGNPNLRPALSNNINLTYSRFKKASINLSLGYSFANNTIQRVTLFDSLTNITNNNYDNIGKNRSVNLYGYGSYPITKKLNVSLNAGISYVWFQSIINGAPTKTDGIRGNVSTSLSYRFDNGIRLNGNIFYNSPGVFIQGRSNAVIFSGISTSKDIIKDKLTFSASVSNPFSKFRTARNELTGVNFTQISDSRVYFRTFSGGLNYRFGKLKEAIKKNKRGINNDDVSSSSAQ